MVRKGEVTNRTDAEYYELIFNMSAKSIFPLYSIGSQFNIKDGDHNKFPPKHDSNEFSGVRYLRSQDLKDGEVIDLKPVFVSQEYFKKLKRSEIKSGYILFSIMASIGSIVIYPENREDCTANRAVGILIPKKNNKILSQYFKALFNTNFGETLIQTLKKGGVQQRINLFDFSSLKIPIPPLEIQVEIIDFFETAYTAKKQKEAEAAALLASIDGYLLQELGITLPPPSEKKTYFLTRSNQVSGGRFDPKKYVPENEQLIGSLSTGKYKAISLKDFLVQSVSGDWGIDEAKEGFSETLVIRATEFDNMFNLKLENNRVKYRFINEIKLEKMDLQVNDLLIEKSGGSENQPVGRIAIITEDLADNYSLAFSNFIHKIRIDSARINSDYLFNFLKTAHNIKITDLMQSQTNGIRNLIMKEYFNMKIPFPTPEKQTEIANHISALRTQAKQLQQRAATELAHAKLHIEHLILGE